MTSPLQRAFCLAMTVLGPLTKRASPEATPPNSAPESPLGRRLYSLFQTVEWSTLCAMTSVFGTVEHCLRWLGVNYPVTESDLPALLSGARQLKEWEIETRGIAEDVSRLARELQETRQRCLKLTDENADLREKCKAYSEAGLILEQDRQQLQSLLYEKCKLIEENQHLEREISSLHELLDYATEHALEEDDGFDSELENGSDAPFPPSPPFPSPTTMCDHCTKE